MFIVKRTWATVETEAEEITHTAENGYKCSDPECICHDAEESSAPMLWYVPSTEETMRAFRAGRAQ